MSGYYAEIMYLLGEKWNLNFRHGPVASRFMHVYARVSVCQARHLAVLFSMGTQAPLHTNVNPCNAVQFKLSKPMSILHSLTVSWQKYGDPNGLRWTGMVDAVGKDKFDIGLTGFSQVGKLFCATIWVHVVQRCCSLYSFVQSLLPLQVIERSEKADFSIAFTSSAIR